MSYRCFASTAAVAAMGVVVLLISPPAGGQALSPAPNPHVGKVEFINETAKAAKAFTPPRTPDGQPDLQGVWNSNTLVPLQRPKGLAEFYTEAELKAKMERDRKTFSDPAYDSEAFKATDASRKIEQNPGDTRTASGLSKYGGNPELALHYDMSNYGTDRSQAPLVYSRRTSIIVGPEGTIPPLTPEARQRRAEREAKAKGHEFDGPENQNLSIQCLVKGGSSVPMEPSEYNSNWRIVQAPGYVSIQPEMGRARIIPTDGRSHLAKNIHQLLGDPVGHWEGNTLVVDTTNFTDRNPFEGAQNVHVIERFTRVDDDTMLYQFTVEDPGMWIRPWSGEMTVTRLQQQMYEYACSEGDYDLGNTLRGARVAEEEAAKKAAQEKGNK